MKRGIYTAIIVLLSFLAILWFEKPLREILIDNSFESVPSDLSSGIFVRGILIVLSIYLIRKFEFINFTGLNRWKNFKNLQALLIPAVFILIGLSSNWSTYVNSQFSWVILFLASTIMVGIVEEFVFRGIVFPLFIHDLRNFNRPILMAAILSSLLFGMVHFVNIFSQPENIVGIISQVFFATSIGVFFCGLMVRTENILLPCIIHALVNFSFGSGELIAETSDLHMSGQETGKGWNSILPTAILFTFIFSGGVFMIIKSETYIVLQKLKTLDIR